MGLPQLKRAYVCFYLLSIFTIKFKIPTYFNFFICTLKYIRIFCIICHKSMYPYKQGFLKDDSVIQQSVTSLLNSNNICWSVQMPEMILRHSLVLNPTTNRTTELSGTHHCVVKISSQWLHISVEILIYTNTRQTVQKFTF